MSVIGIVGAEAAKFTPEREHQARELIRAILYQQFVHGMTSGGCHLGGIDIWAEEEAKDLGVPQLIFKPKNLRWSGGYRERNILIAKECTELHNIVVASYPETYTGMRFSRCYHCTEQDHIKSGGCWTRNYAKKLGKCVYQWIVP